MDEQRQTAEIAPIYDCGSCLYPQLAVEDMQCVLNSEEEINARIFTFPSSAIEENGKKISYFSYISSLKSNDCNEALKRVHARIDIERLSQIIDDTPTLVPIQKDFYTILLRERKEKILDYSMEQLLVKEQGSLAQDRP